MAAPQPTRPADHFRYHYTIVSQLGKGAYAVVYECVKNGTNEHYAVKVVDKSKAGPRDIDDISHEINIMEAIGYHSNVVQMYEYFQTDRHLYIVMDLLSGGMLFDRIVQLKHYSEKNAAELVRNLLSALAHIHSKNIIHRDLKPENLLLRYSESAAPSGTSYLTDVCLADFGLAGYVPSSTCCGSPSYIAPEVINVGYYRTQTEPYDAKCDIWSLGVITYILLSGKMPFHGANFRETFQRIVANQWDFVGDIWGRVTSTAKEFIKRCLIADPKRRPSAKELLNDPWVAETQPDVHLEDSLEGLRRFNAQQKIRAAVRVFCCTQSLLGGLDRTPPFMRYLRHEDKYSTLVLHQSQTNPELWHTIDFGKAMFHAEPGWRLQNCCTCPSEMVCRHIQNVHEYLFVGSRGFDVYPFIDELNMMRAEAEDDLAINPNSKEAANKLQKIKHAIEAACDFSDELAKIPPDQLKPNFMLDNNRLTIFRERGGPRSMAFSSDSTTSELTPKGKLQMAAKNVVTTQKAQPPAAASAAPPVSAGAKASGAPPRLSAPAKQVNGGKTPVTSPNATKVSAPTGAAKVPSPVKRPPPTGTAPPSATEKPKSRSS